MRHNLTPLLISIEDYSNTKDPVIPDDIKQLTRPVYLAPRYYLIIHRPPNNNQTGYIYPDNYRVGIPKYGLLKNTVQLLLPPSIGYGVTSCYRVEYWQWDKIVYPPGYSMSGIPRRNRYAKHLPSNKYSLIKEEYWYIPNEDGSLNIDDNYAWRPVYRNVVNKLRQRLITKTIPMIRSYNPLYPDMDVLPPGLGKEVLQIKSIGSDIPLVDPSIELVSHERLVSGDIVTTDIGLSWGQYAPPLDTKYDLIYTRPLTLEDVIFDPEPSNGVLKPNPNRNHVNVWY
jgi:hypothetical protein